MKFTIISILVLLPVLSLAQQSRTVILSEEEYNRLVSTANGATCPAPQNTSPQRNNLAKNGFSLRLGGGVNYLYGSDVDANSNFDTDFLSWYAEGMLGYVFNSDQQGIGTTIGAFLSVGNTNENSIQKFLNDGQVAENAENESQNLYYKLELGTVLFQTLRLSTGTGYQEFTTTNGDEERAFFYSTTGGLQFGGRFLKLALDLNFMYGRELSETVVRPSVGVVLQL